MQAVTDKYERRSNFFRCEVDAGIEVRIVAKDKRLGLAIGNQRCRGFFFNDFARDKFQGLVEAINAGGLQACLGESLDDVSLRFAQSLTSGLAAFQIVVG